MKKDSKNFDFEEEIGRHLDERRITPSENAWERVNLLREKKAKPEKKRGFLWIAAAILVGFGLLLVFNRKASDKTTETSVVMSDPVPSDKKDRNQMVIPSDTSEITAQPEPQPAERLASHPETIQKQPMHPILPENQHQLQASVSQETIGIEKQKIREITAAVKLIASSGETVDEDDIDNLIEKARKEIAAGNGLSKETDASALLRDSEDELSKEFRTNVFKELVKHKRIRIAFGDR